MNPSCGFVSRPQKVGVCFSLRCMRSVAQAGLVLLILTQAGCGTRRAGVANEPKGASTQSARPVHPEPTVGFSNDVRAVVTGLTQAVGTASGELVRSAELARSAREAQDKFAAEKRRMADRAIQELANAQQAAKTAQTRLATIQKQIANAQNKFDARRKAEESVDKRLEFIREVIAELAEHGMPVWELDESIGDRFNIRFDAAKKLTIAAPAGAGDDRSTSRSEFRQLIKIIISMEDKDLPVRRLSYESGNSLKITYTRKDRSLVISPKGNAQ